MRALAARQSVFTAHTHKHTHTRSANNKRPQQASKSRRHLQRLQSVRPSPSANAQRTVGAHRAFGAHTHLRFPCAPSLAPLHFILAAPPPPPPPVIAAARLRLCSPGLLPRSQSSVEKWSAISSSHRPRACCGQLPFLSPRFRCSMPCLTPVARSFPAFSVSALLCVALLCVDDSESWP